MVFLRQMPERVDIAVTDHGCGGGKSRRWNDAGINGSDKCLMITAKCLRNSCIYTLFSYGATISEVSEEMDITRENVRRYQNINYIDETSRSIRNLVKLKAELPSDE